MIEVHPGLFVGDESDALATAGEPGWFIVHACKEPHHRAALGYTGKGAPKGDPEYLVAHRPGCVALNLIDAPEPEMIPAACMAGAFAAISRELDGGKRVLVHCNQGRSRAPTIALLWLCLTTDRFDDCDYDAAAERFRTIYPSFAPAGGMEGYARNLFAGEARIEAPEPEPPPEVAPRLAPRSGAPTIFRF